MALDTVLYSSEDELLSGSNELALQSQYIILRGSASQESAVDNPNFGEIKKYIEGISEQESKFIGIFGVYYKNELLLYSSNNYLRTFTDGAEYSLYTRELVYPNLLRGRSNQNSEAPNVFTTRVVLTPEGAGQVSDVTGKLWRGKSFASVSHQETSGISILAGLHYIKADINQYTGSRGYLIGGRHLAAVSSQITHGNLVKIGDGIPIEAHSSQITEAYGNYVIYSVGLIAHVGQISTPIVVLTKAPCLESRFGQQTSLALAHILRKTFFYGHVSQEISASSAVMLPELIPLVTHIGEITSVTKSVLISKQFLDAHAPISQKTEVAISRLTPNVYFTSKEILNQITEAPEIILTEIQLIKAFIAQQTKSYEHMILGHALRAKAEHVPSATGSKLTGKAFKDAKSDHLTGTYAKLSEEYFIKSISGQITNTYPDTHLARFAELSASSSTITDIFADINETTQIGIGAASHITSGLSLLSKGPALKSVTDLGQKTDASTSILNEQTYISSTSNQISTADGYLSEENYIQVEAKQKTAGYLVTSEENLLRAVSNNVTNTSTILSDNGIDLHCAAQHVTASICITTLGYALTSISGQIGGAYAYLHESQVLRCTAVHKTNGISKLNKITDIKSPANQITTGDGDCGFPEYLEIKPDGEVSEGFGKLRRSKIGYIDRPNIVLYYDGS